MFKTDANCTYTIVIYYKLKKFSQKKSCKQGRYVNPQGTMTKWPVQKPTNRTIQKQAEHQDTTNIQKKTFLCFSDYSFTFFDLI